ncbi:hypothetical protein WMY93_002208 [Mugilogobius chulae]|uniref:Deoxyribonuclease-2-alpha n=1 Tax=Mugilogobius chulae TaxID=88201 RepID=A0AAW0PWI4_9GOBI
MWAVWSLVLIWSCPTSAWLSWFSSAPSDPTPVTVSCKDQDNNNVDWYILYKAPNSLNSIYIDSEGKKFSSSNSLKPISDKDGVLANTLRPMFSAVRKMPVGFGFLSYNDQPPGAQAKYKQFGHSKGVVMGDSGSEKALWLIATPPQFPFRRNQDHFWPESGYVNGQIFMCVSLPFSALLNVGKHLQNIRAYPFDYDLPTTFPQELRDAADWKQSQSLWGKFQEMKTINEKELKLMAKPVAQTAGGEE